MKKILVLVLALAMVFAALPVLSASAEETNPITYSDHMTNNSDVGYDYDITNASIAWVKQGSGALIWVAADDARNENEIIAQAKSADPSLNNLSEFAVLKGTGTAETPNTKGSPAEITVSVFSGRTVLSIDGKYSHFVAGSAQGSPIEEPTEVADPEPEPDPEPAPDPEPEETDPVIEGETTQIRIDVPAKMAVAFEDGTIYYGGEMKEVVIGQEYMFRMCAVNWENGIYDGNENGLAGTVVFKMTVVHQKAFLQLAQAAKENPQKYTVKGMDVIDNEAKTIVVNGDAEDSHLETDVNNFFMAYRFHFENEDTDSFDMKTGIDKVVNTPVEGLSVNLPLGSTITCNAYNGAEKIDTDNVFISRNSGEGIYDDVLLTSVNDYTWNA